MTETPRGLPLPGVVSPLTSRAAHYLVPWRQQVRGSRRPGANSGESFPGRGALFTVSFCSAGARSVQASPAIETRHVGWGPRGRPRGKRAGSGPAWPQLPLPAALPAASASMLPLSGRPAPPRPLCPARCRAPPRPLLQEWPRSSTAAARPAPRCFPYPPYPAPSAGANALRS